MAFPRPRRGRLRSMVLVLTVLGELPMLLLLRALARPYVPGVTWWAIGLGVALTLPVAERVRRGFGDQAEQGILGKLLVVSYAFWGASVLAAIIFAPIALIAHFSGFSLRIAGATAAIIGAIEGIAGVSFKRTRPRLRRIVVPIEGLPRALDGYRIAHMSDLHVGVHTPPERLRAWVERVNELGADLVAVTGDLITSGDDYVDDMARELGRLRARNGVALCLGNHDYFVPDPEKLVAALEREGIDVLRNRGRVVGAVGDGYFLAGVDDTWTQRHNVGRALAERPPGMPAILLAHDPKLFPSAAEHGATLVLSGHTHGGQVAVPLLARTLNVARLAYRHTAGLYREGASHLYVNRGAGTTGLPLRIGSPSEIAVVELRVA